jgi:hypothetical protein
MIALAPDSASRCAVAGVMTETRKAAIAQMRHAKPTGCPALNALCRPTFRIRVPPKGRHGPRRKFFDAIAFEAAIV